MGQKIRDFMISGLAIFPLLMWLLSGSAEVFAVTASMMLLITIVVAMAFPPSADPPPE